MINTENFNKSIAIYSYAVGIGVVYIFAFWRAIGFNVFSYLSLTDVLFSPLNRLLVIFLPSILAIVFFLKIEKDKSIKVSYFGFLLTIFIVYYFDFSYLYDSVKLFNEIGFYYRNEVSILIMCGLLVFLSILMTFLSITDRKNTYIQFVSLALAHIVCSMSAGYLDGKSFFNGTSEAYFLEQKSLCDKHDIRDWVYLEKYSNYAFFMNTIDKRICIINNINFNLISRKYKEGL